jgi:release factor glutamine methyltransferase
MTIDAWLRDSWRQLAEAGIESARLDCLLLLEDALERDRSWILAHPEYEVPNEIVDILNNKVARRKLHIPLAYIRGHSEFYGHAFLVDEHVLIPRPESESFLEILAKLHLAAPPYATIIDVGTGSGALAISTALEYTETKVLATDIDPHCLDVARRNAARLGAVVEFVAADLLQPIYANAPPLLPADIILANLPYVPDGFAINKAAGHEPGLALFGGPDGLDLYRRLFDSLAGTNFNQKMLNSSAPKYVLTEALESQHDALAKIATEHNYQETDTLGLVQVFQR